ncbi:MAG: hypothetical protein IPL11_11060 [Candidatus Accumulibacter sp.]|nr:hypothetical protein [Accumulibacter sp.]
MSLLPTGNAFTYTPDADYRRPTASPTWSSPGVEETTTVDVTVNSGQHLLVNTCSLSRARSRTRSS